MVFVLICEHSKRFLIPLIYQATCRRGYKCDLHSEWSQAMLWCKI